MLNTTFARRIACPLALEATLARGRQLSRRGRDQIDHRIKPSVSPYVIIGGTPSLDWRDGEDLAAVTSRKQNRLEDGDLRAIECLAPSDPARDLIAEILRVVLVSHWSFARFKGNGSSDTLFLPEDDAEEPHQAFDHLKAEFDLQRQRSATGSRLSATLGQLEAPYVSGITLLFADKRTNFGILSLLRTDELGPFTSAEIRALTLAVDSAADRLSGFTLTEAPAAKASLAGDREPSDTPSMYVLDQKFRVILTWDAQEQRNVAVTNAHARLADRLPRIIEDAVRDVASTWSFEPATHTSGSARPVPFLVVRTQPLSGPTGLFIGVLLERAPGSHVFAKAADSFALSPRELQTFASLVEGLTLSEIADRMSITSSTVQDHIKSMLGKTNSKNRSELIGKILSPRHLDG